jgi:predicted Zn-dependent protease
LKRNQIIAVLLAVVAAVVLMRMPRTASVEEVVLAATENTEHDAKVDEAVAIIQSGEGAPMQAIGMLLEVLQENPDHEKALLWLGNFSMMSGQWEKAVDRFHHLTKIRPEVEMYWFNKSQSLLQMGDTTAALTSAQEYLNTHPEATRINDLVAGLQN